MDWEQLFSIFTGYNELASQKHKYKPHLVLKIILILPSYNPEYNVYYSGLLEKLSFNTENNSTIHLMDHFGHNIKAKDNHSGSVLW